MAHISGKNEDLIFLDGLLISVLRKVIGSILVMLFGQTIEANIVQLLTKVITIGKTSSPQLSDIPMIAGHYV